MHTILALIGMASASNVLWDGRLNNYTSAAFLYDWSWSNQVGPYQYYIHGDGPRTEYVALSTDFKNPADTSSDRGLQITINNSSSWHGQNMMRTELIPQTSAAINAGKVFYHFSMQHTATAPPSQTDEHQVCFFESHFTEMKYGLLNGASGTSSNQLQWFANSESHWNVSFEAGVWHNIAYEIDFDAQTVTFYHSTGAENLKLTAGPVSATTSSNGADWHLGVLRLPSTTGSSDEAAEDWHFSGVYIENGELTESVSGPGDTAAVRVTASSTSAPTTLQTIIKETSSTASTSTTCISSDSSAIASNPASVFSLLTTSITGNATSATLHIAENPAPTFIPTASLSENYTPSSADRWYALTSSSEYEVVYATVTVTA